MEFIQYFIVTALVTIVSGTVEKASDLITFEQPLEIYAELGKSVNILAKASEGRTIQFCRWDSLNNTKVGNSGIIFVNDQDEIPSFSVMAHQSDGETRLVKGYKQFGQGLSKGQCGITIEQVSEEDLTSWKFLLIEFSKMEGNPTVVTRDVLVIRAVEPDPPVIQGKEHLQNIFPSETSLSNGSLSESINVTCCSKNGVPHPQLKFVLDDEVVQTAVPVPSTMEESVCIQWDIGNLKKDDNGKSLKCVSEHLTTMNRDDSLVVDSLVLNVAYKPILLTQLTYPFNETTELNLSEQNRRIKLEYTANPKPIITWYQEDPHGFVTDVASNDAFTIEETLPPSPEEGCIWGSILTVHNALNYSITFKVVTSNYMGTIETFVIVFPSEQVSITSTPAPSNQDDKLNFLWIIIPLILIILLILAILIFILVARSKGICCYKNQTGEYHVKEQGNSVYNPTTVSELNDLESQKMLSSPD